VLYLYVYPTLIEKLEPLVRDMLLNDGFALARVVTVEYHLKTLPHAQEHHRLRLYDAASVAAEGKTEEGLD